MTDRLREGGLLVTEHQLPAVLAERDVFLTACPGSGKTRTAAVRAARLADDGRRVAACSYTNIGVEELRRALAHDIGVTLGPAHFTGTLHRFLLRYALHPFGQRILRCSGSPRVVDPEAPWDPVVFDNPKIRLPLHHFQFRPDGTMCVRNTPPKFPYSPERALAERGARARQLKLDIARQRGWVSADDAMYFALEVLRELRTARTALAGRFDELLVDEAQDTSELQLACIRVLHDTGGLDSLVLIGDLDQSIFSYNGAHPNGCVALADDRGLQPIVLSENRRSSQRICDTTIHLSSRATPDRAVGADHDCPLHPELIVYPSSDPTATLAEFTARLTYLGEDPADAALLARTNDLVDAINRTRDPAAGNPRALAVARVVHAQRAGLTLRRRDLDRLDHLLARLAWDRHDLVGLAPGQRWELRRATTSLIRAAPDLNTDLRTWTVAVRDPMSAAIAQLTDHPARQIGKALAAKTAAAEHHVVELAAHNPEGLRARTVHDLKGATVSSVLLVLDRPRGNRTAPAELLARALHGKPLHPAETEEVRIAYVALTRARRLCQVALPDVTAEPILSDYLTRGFVRHQ